MSMRSARLRLKRVKSPDIQIRILERGETYEAHMQIGRGRWERFPIGLTRNDVAELNVGLQDILQRAADCFDFSNDNEIRCRDVLSGMIEKGRYAFRRVFSNEVARNKIQTALKDTKADIQFTSETFTIPWELLYDAPPDAVDDAANFWGMRHVVSRTIIQDVSPAAYADPVIRCSRANIGLVTDLSLPEVVSEEIPALLLLGEDNPLDFTSLRTLAADDKKTGLAEFKSFFGASFHLVHFACHAFERRPLSTSVLRVSDGFELSIEDIVGHELELIGFPFVIFNACRTGTMSPLHTSNWAALLWQRGARGVLATEFRVPDAFAPSFILRVYYYLLEGKSVGESLLLTRKDFWNQESNPLGLAYALYAPPDVRFEL